jgi:hypothetical protein
MLFALLVTVFVQAPAAAPPQVDAARVNVSAPRTVVEIDTGKLKGQPDILAWSPDGQQLYLRTVEYDRWKNRRSSHYLLALDGKAPKKIDSEPPWAETYWTWKSASFAPREPAFRIEVESQHKMATATAVPTGGEIAGMGGDPTAGGGAGQGMSTQAAANAAMQAQQLTTITMKLKGTLLGEWVNERPDPGSVFGWAPAPLGLIVFAKKDGGKLVLMDRDGHAQDIAGTKDCLLPAWSDDGTRVVYLQKKDKKKYTVMLVTVGS